MVLSVAAALADPDEEEAAREIVVQGERPRTSASGRSLDRPALEALPARSTDDVLRAMPGLHLSAHGGHGKAYQYFLRGFDAVHGADLAVEVQGVPINERSNVHANGYLDLHFVPPVLLASAVLSPGTWRPDAGNYAVAGSASLQLGLERTGGLVWLGGGTDRSAEATRAWRPPDSAPGTFLVADTTLGRGIGMARSWRQLRVGAGVEGSRGGVHTRAWVLAYEGAFESPGVLRLDDYQLGEVGFYDAYPGSGGGRSSRLLAAAQLIGGSDRVVWQGLAWGGLRALRLQQNFTGWYDDPVHGDGTRQSYRAGSGGARGRVAWSVSSALLVQTGVDARVDRLRQEERGVTADGGGWGGRVARLEAIQGELGAWIAAPWTPRRGLRIEPGARIEGLWVDPDGSAASWAPVVAPKLSVVVGDGGPATGFASYGRGFRSPDVRGVGEGGRAPLAVADMVEVGGTAAGRWLALRLAGFAALVSDEIVFDHVAARYLATGTTRRLGVDGGMTVRPLDGVRLQSDISFSDGRYRRSGVPIPYAPRLLANVGAYLERVPVGGVALTAGVRTWVLGPRPLPGGFASRTAVVADLTTTLDVGPWRLSIEIDNALGNRWRDGEFVFPSRWDRDAPRGELPVRHFTAGAPSAARVAVGRRF